MEDNSNKNSGGLVSLIFIIWFIASIIFLVISGKNAEYQWLLPIIFGQYFLVFGAIAIISTRGSKKKTAAAIGILFVLIGGGVLTLGLMHHFGDEDMKKKIVDSIPFIASLGFSVGGICGIVGSIVSRNSMVARCTYETQAQVIDIKSRVGSRKNHTTVYCPVYQAYVNGETVQLCDNVYSNVKVPNIGDIRPIFIDPDDPESYYEPKMYRMGFLIKMFVFSMFTVIGAVVFVVMLTVMRFLK